MQVNRQGMLRLQCVKRSCLPEKEDTDYTARCTEVPDALRRCPPYCCTALLSSTIDLIIRTIPDVHHVRDDAVQMCPDHVPDGPPRYACLEALPP
jgi:hypothetical protein